ncbi:MAG: Mur ligase family protein [Defluviitaleaceae bacterium]|nr:Mur ligase family protein [Defluviitaleaceae bacterium]
MTPDTPKKPIINMEFLRNSLNQSFKSVKFPDVEKLQGINIEEFVFSSMCLIENNKKGCVAFVHARHESSHYNKIAEVLRQRHAALPDSDPNKLTPAQIADEVLLYRLKEMADKAIEGGAVVLVSRFQIKEYPCIIVPDVKDAFLCLYESYAAQFNTKTVQVTGSFGKTSACQLVYDMLTANDKITHRNKLNGNDYPGIFSALNRLEYEHEFYVQETQEAPVSWTAAAGSRVLKPKVGIITNAGGSHLEIMKTKANVAHACLGIQDGIPSDGILAINGDDSLLRKHSKKLRVPIVTYAIDNHRSDCLADNIQSTHEGTTFDLHYKGKTVPIKIASLGNHNVYNAMSAFIAGIHLGLTEEEVVNGIAAHKPEGIRQNLVTVNGRVLYIDCFNASVETMSAAVEIISNTTPASSEGKRIAILGSISELGAENFRGHTKVGKTVLNSNIDVLICHGHNAAIIADAAKDKPGLKIFKTQEQRHLVQLIQQETKSGDILLIKGSRTANLEFALDLALGTYFSLEAEEQRKHPVVTFGKFVVEMHKFHSTMVDYKGDRARLTLADELTWKDGAQGVYNLFGVGENAFANRDFLEAVRLPNTVKVIGKRAFAGCPNLSKIYIPSSVVNIAEGAFDETPVTFCADAGSYAYEYAVKHGIAVSEYSEFGSLTTFESVSVSSIADTGHLLLVNGKTPLETIPAVESFGLADLVAPVVSPKTIYATEAALGAVKQMVGAAKSDGIGDLFLVAGYRSHSQQNYLYERNPKDGRTALPHHSEHHTGLALDVFVKGLKQHEMEGSPQARWLENNAHRFGLIMRYPKGKEAITGVPHEPWHFRFVGRVHAHYMYYNNIVFEEYLDLLRERRNLTIDLFGTEFQVFYQQPENDIITVPKEHKCIISRDNRGGYIITEDKHHALY